MTNKFSTFPHKKNIASEEKNCSKIPWKYKSMIFFIIFEFLSLNSNFFVKKWQIKETSWETMTKYGIYDHILIKYIKKIFLKKLK